EAFLLAVAMVLTIRGVPQFRPLEAGPGATVPLGGGGLRAFTLMIELVFGFFATAGALAADWGMVSRTERDVRLGGLIGVAFASSTVATLALLIVAGALGPHSPLPDPGMLGGPWVETFRFSVRRAVLLGIGGTLGGTFFLVFGLGSLAPTCYS